MKRFARKETIYLRGEEARTLYRLEEGLVRVVELLPDGTFVTTTYGHWTEGEQAYIVSVRFKLAELDGRLPRRP